MAKQIIVLDRYRANDGNAYRVAFWASVPGPKQTFWSGFQTASVWKNATAAENTAISSGAVREKVGSFTPPQGWTIAQIQAQLIDYWNDWQAEVNADQTYSRYGTFYDGTSWTAGGA